MATAKSNGVTLELTLAEARALHTLLGNQTLDERKNAGIGREESDTLISPIWRALDEIVGEPA